LDSKGVKNILAQRLQEALDAEKASEEAGGQQEETKEEVKTEEPVKAEADVVLIDEVKPGEINPDDLVVTDEVDEKMETNESEKVLILW
jgi:hypothetical protein